jgi:hypothetical protein
MMHDLTTIVIFAPIAFLGSFVYGVTGLGVGLFTRFCRKVRFLGKIQKFCVRNSMAYRLQNSRKSNFATEPKRSSKKSQLC